MNAKIKQEKLFKEDFTCYAELALITQRKWCSKYNRIIEREIKREDESPLSRT